MSDYAYTYPVDTSFIDRATEPGRIRDTTHRIFQTSREHGTDLWDLVEDDRELTDAEKDQVHRAFGAAESDDDLADKRARGVRYGR
jgi:hypothetical protein